MIKKKTVCIISRHAMNNLFIPPAHFIDRLKTEEVHIISLTAKLGQI